MSRLHQYMTPAWAAERLVETYFGFLDASHIVLEPTCGKGAFLAAIPRHVDAFGVEIDPALAAQARAASGRLVIEGDIRMVSVPKQPTAVIGNPPFNLKLVRDLLLRCAGWLPEGGVVGLIVPTYMLQTAKNVLEFRQRWIVKADHIPRAIFGNRLSYPLVFATFQKGGSKLIGFALYDEATDVWGMPKEYERRLNTPGETWRRVFEDALTRLGGEADLQDIYREVEPNRPTDNPWWKEKIRQTARNYPCPRRGRYALEAA